MTSKAETILIAAIEKEANGQFYVGTLAGNPIIIGNQRLGSEGTLEWTAYMEAIDELINGRFVVRSKIQGNTTVFSLTPKGRNTAELYTKWNKND